MEVDQIRTADDVERYIEGCLNDFEEGISEKEETVVNLAELVAHVYAKATEEKRIIPKRRFKKDDKVRIKDGVSSKTYSKTELLFLEEMDDLVGKTMTVDKYTDANNYVKCEGIDWFFLEEWLEPYEELKKGDLAIFWDEVKKNAVIRMYDRLNESAVYIRHSDQSGFSWHNAIKFQSKEQYERFIKGGEV